MTEQYTVHTSTLFDPKKKKWLSDISITVDPSNGSIVKVFTRESQLDAVPVGDVDLRGKYVLPGFVDAHAHIFLHSYA
jgi:imidazolonepropionase-like amidohydrolase